VSQRGRNGLERRGYTLVRQRWLSVEGRPSDCFRRPFGIFSLGETTEDCNNSRSIVCGLAIEFFHFPSQLPLDTSSPELLLKELVLHFTNSFMPG